MNNDVWKEFAAHEISHSVAHYLITILDLRRSKGYAILKDVSEALRVTKGSASVQLKNLKEKGFVEEIDRHHLKLTEAGMREASKVIYNRRVISELLHGVLGLDPAQAESDACKVEHLFSHDASHRLLAFVQLMKSDDPAVVAFRKCLEEHELSCPGLEKCNLCDDVCLVDID